MQQLTKQQMNKYLNALIGNQELVEQWWKTHNLAFGAEPNKVWETEPKKVFRYLLGQIG